MRARSLVVIGFAVTVGVVGATGPMLLSACGSAPDGPSDAGASSDAGDSTIPPGPSCKQSSECATMEFCLKDTCDPAAAGACTPVPGTRTTGYCQNTTDFVCGCDGKTYPYPCLAHAMGINVASKGPCALPEGGGACAQTSDCGAGLYCKRDHCASATGTCAPMPNFQVCFAAEAGTTCGCDHQSYRNDCEAASYGINIDFEGQCPPLPSGPCTSQMDCGDPSYSKLVFCKPTTCASPAGACTAIPGACPALYDPVCGCDGKIYMNACFADQAKVGSYPDDAGCTDR